MDEITERNIYALKAHCDESRKLIRGLMDELKLAENRNKQLQQQVDHLSSQVRALQVAAFTGGATSGNQY